jgi:hypothetical protein
MAMCTHALLLDLALLHLAMAMCTRSLLVLLVIFHLAMAKLWQCACVFALVVVVHLAMAICTHSLLVLLLQLAMAMCTYSLLVLLHLAMAKLWQCACVFARCFSSLGYGKVHTFSSCSSLLGYGSVHTCSCPFYSSSSIGYGNVCAMKYGAKPIHLKGENKTVINFL